MCRALALDGVRVATDMKNLAEVRTSVTPRYFAMALAMRQIVFSLDKITEYTDEAKFHT